MSLPAELLMKPKPLSVRRLIVPSAIVVLRLRSCAGPRKSTPFDRRPAVLFAPDRAGCRVITRQIVGCMDGPRTEGAGRSVGFRVRPWGRSGGVSDGLAAVVVVE